jgi:hypothetical protein
MTRSEGDNRLFSFQTPPKTDRASEEGKLAAIHEGIRHELAPFQTLWDETKGFLASVPPNEVTYEPKLKDIYPAKYRKRTLQASASWQLPNLFPPTGEDPINLDLTISATVQGSFAQETPDDQLVYALWYLDEYNPLYDRAFRGTLFQPRTLLDTRVRRRDTSQLIPVVASQLLDRANSLGITVSQHEAIGTETHGTSINSPKVMFNQFAGRLSRGDTDQVMVAIQEGLHHGVNSSHDFYDAGAEVAAAFQEALETREGIKSLSAINGLLQKNNV